MEPAPHVLVALDESDASMHAVQHVGHVFARQPGVTVRMLHVVGPLPQEMLEHGGASDPDAESRLEAELEAQQQRWIRETCEAFLPVFAEAEKQLVEAGLPADAITTQCSESIPEDKLAQLILDDAHASGCDTVVVGQNAYTWFGALFHRHVGDVLKGMANGVRVVVVP